MREGWSGVVVWKKKKIGEEGRRVKCESMEDRGISKWRQGEFIMNGRGM